MEKNLSVKVTLELTTEVTLAELKSFVTMAEAAGAELEAPLVFEMNENDELSGYSVFVDPSRIKMV